MKILWAAVAAFLMATGPALAQLDHAKNLVRKVIGDAESQDPTRDPNQDSANKTPVDAGASQDPAGWLTVPGPGGKTVRVYVASPKHQSGSVPALLVIQEWWGVNQDIQQRTLDFAKRGYFAVAVDLYDGKSTADPKEAAPLRQALTDEGCARRIQAGLDYVLSQKQVPVDPARVGIIGWCMGGEYALKSAVADARIKATAVFYGPLVTDAATLKKLQGPVLGVFGNEDKHPSPEDVNAFEQALKAGGIPATIYRFDNVGHAFASPPAKAMGMYHEKEAQDAWAKCWAWLNETLKPAG